MVKSMDEHKKELLDKIKRIEFGSIQFVSEKQFSEHIGRIETRMLEF